MNSNLIQVYTVTALRSLHIVACVECAQWKEWTQERTSALEGDTRPFFLVRTHFFQSPDTQTNCQCEFVRNMQSALYMAYDMNIDIPFFSRY